MFNFKHKDKNQDSKNNPQTEKNTANQQQDLNVEVHKMPDKFYDVNQSEIKNKIPQEKTTSRPRKNSGSLKKNVIIGIIIGVLVIALLALGGWFLIKTFDNEQPSPNYINQTKEEEKIQPQENQPEQNNNTSTQQTPTQPEPEEEVEFCSAENCQLCGIEECRTMQDYCHLEDLCQNSTSTMPIAEEDVFGTCPNYVCMPGPAPKEEAPKPTSTPKQTLKPSRDSDSDGLTDVEEGLWGTDPFNPDTDGEGFEDGHELINFYNPVKPGVGVNKITDTRFVKSYNNKEYGYSILYPSSWQPENSIEEDPAQVTFTSQTEEFVQIIVQENNTAYDNIKDWYQNENVDISQSQIKERLVGNWYGVESPDGLNVYILKNNKIYIIAYNVGLKNTMNYKTTYEMMLRSFQFFDNPLEQDQ